MTLLEGEKEKTVTYWATGGVVQTRPGQKDRRTGQKNRTEGPRCDQSPAQICIEPDWNQRDTRTTTIGSLCC